MTTDEEKLLLDNLGLVGSIASKYYIKFGGAFEYDDLKSVGTLGLIKAIQNYNEDLGYAFSTYAYRVIQTKIIRYFLANKKHSTNISLSTPVFEDVELLETIPSEYDFFEEFSKSVELEKLNEAVNSLNDTYQKIVKYRVSGLTFVEIGKLLNINTSQVNSMYNKALNILRYKLKDLRRWYNES